MKPTMWPIVLAVTALAGCTAYHGAAVTDDGILYLTYSKMMGPSGVFRCRDHWNSIVCEDIKIKQGKVPLASPSTTIFVPTRPAKVKRSSTEDPSKSRSSEAKPVLIRIGSSWSALSAAKKLTHYRKQPIRILMKDGVEHIGTLIKVRQDSIDVKKLDGEVSLSLIEVGEITVGGANH